MTNIIEKTLHAMGWHKWDDSPARPFVGLNRSWCSICNRTIGHGIPIHRGRRWGRQQREEDDQ